MLVFFCYSDWLGGTIRIRKNQALQEFDELQNKDAYTQSYNIQQAQIMNMDKLG